jgi:predicted hydrocarbon binding protein
MSSRASSDRVPLSGATAFRSESGEGAIRLPDDQRVVAISEPLMQHLHFAIIEQLGETAQDALYRTGYEWALQDMLRLTRQMREEAAAANFDFWQQDVKGVLSRWWTTPEALGWGSATFDFQSAARGLTFVELRQSIVADAFAGADQPVCHLYAGLFAGALSFFERAERHAVEVQCTATGGNPCKFVVGPGAEVDAAEAWRQQGVAAPEIFRRLT